MGTAVLTLDKYKKLSHADITAIDYSEDMLVQARRMYKKYLYLTGICQLLYDIIIYTKLNHLK